MNQKSITGKISFLVMAILLLLLTSAQAANIDPGDDGSQYAWGENVGWFNFEPSLGPGVTVDDYGVTGYVWAENIGWINLSPAQYGGVENDGAGNLSGWAWGENVGWISFSCENTLSCDDVGYGVTIDYGAAPGGNDRIIGYAWGENIGWVNFDLTTQSEAGVVTLIVLESFTAEPGNGEVILKWKTASEIDNAGFNIYRSEKGGPYVRINDDIIPAEGSPVEGAAYEFVDTDVNNRTSYRYILEDVDFNGNAAQHGPVSATPRLIKGLFQ